MTTTRKFARGEGADGLFLRTLTECIGRLGAIDPNKATALRDAFHRELSKDKRVSENPKEALRHEGAIIERLFSSKPVEVAPSEEIQPKPDITVPSPNADAGFTIEDFGLGDGDLGDPINPYTLEGGPVEKALNEWMLFRKHPYVKTVKIAGKKYTVIGTAVVHNQNGSTVNINCTTGAFKKIRECDENVLVHFNGRAVTMSKDDPNGTAFFMWLCQFKPGRVFRFWMNKMENGVRKDDPRGTFRILITDDDVGHRKVAA
jgi:hypothetical protein